MTPHTRQVLPIIVAAFLVLSTTVSSAQDDFATGPYAKEYAFFRKRFEVTNGPQHLDELKRTFRAIVTSVEISRRKAPGITLGGMLALVVFESGAAMGFYNTRDSENAYRSRLDLTKPFAEQPLARYSYQFGIIPVHTSLLRPCKGFERKRQMFDDAARAAGFVPSARELAAFHSEFDEVCAKAFPRAREELRVVDYYILGSHRIFNVPSNSAGKDLKNVEKFAFFAPEVTAPLFFYPIDTAKVAPADDRAAYCLWGGGDMQYCNPTRQDKILQTWTRFSAPTRP